MRHPWLCVAGGFWPVPLARPGAGKTRTSKAGLFRAAANFFPSSHPNPPGSQNLFSSRLPALSISSTLTAEPGHSPLHSLFSSLEFFLNKPSRWRLARRISKSWACRYVVAIPPENRSLPSRTVRSCLQRARLAISVADPIDLDAGVDGFCDRLANGRRAGPALTPPGSGHSPMDMQQEEYSANTCFCSPSWSTS